MKSLLAIFFSTFYFQPIMSEDSINSNDEIILPASPPQKVHSRYQSNFSHHHDRGFYLAAALGPQWNHSVQKPEAKAIRFGGKLGLGWFVADGVALFGAAWGNFLEQASLVAGGPGVAFLFDGPNLGIDLTLGVGRAFNVMKSENLDDFSETVLAANLSIAKYWWLSGGTSLGASLTSGAHGLTISKGSILTFGWNVGLNLAFLLG